MYSVMWSEHCSYKSSKVHLKQFSEIPQETPIGKMLAGIGENAGVIDIGQGYAVTFKVESHNHPSYVEPYQGAATGVGGIVRDILAMGARPVAVMDPLRFGPLDADDTHRVLPGIVAGVGGYGNCLGLPNIGGEAVFDASYLGNPLVNALCVGVLRHEDLHLAKASGVGNQVILYGAKTGGDGIGGVSILASETFESTGPAKRPSVQVGDPFMEKLLIECTLELFAAGLVSGIQDLGGAGLSCATSELASAGDGGMHVELDTVPLRDSTLAPEEILMSESQERMMAVVAPADVDAFLAICAKWEVDATVIGEVTDTGRLQIDWHGERVVDVPPRSVAHDGPTYQRPFARPDAQDALQADRAEALPRPVTGEELRETLLRLAGSPNLCDKSWITDQYDRYVRGNTVLAQPSDSGMVRVDEETGLGRRGGDRLQRAVRCCSTRTPARSSRSPRPTATWPPAARRPLAISDCLNFGSPEDPGVMWQFAEACRGLKDACVELGIPVTGGNVSLYNQTGETAILPTPVVAVLGVIDDVVAAYADRLRRRRRDACCCWARPARSCPGRSGRTSCTSTSAGCRRRSTWRARRRWPSCCEEAVGPGHFCARPVGRRPRPDAGRVGAAQRGRRAGVARGRPVRRAVLRVGRARASSRCPPTDVERLTALAERHGVPVTELGRTGGDAAVVDGVSSTSTCPLLRDTWTRTLPDALG